MRLNSLVFAGLSVMIGAPSAMAATAACCDKTAMACETKDCDMPCCKHDPAVTMAMNPGLAVDVPSSMEQPKATMLAEAPVRQATQVWFHRPVRVGNTVLLGRYVIEHDDGRMARAEPCTYIYAYNDQTIPVVKFHCWHVERDRAGTNTVVLQSTGDSIQKLVEFQFEGETAVHVLPTVR